MKKLPDLEAWAIFAKVADTGSFARTAQELSLSQATVSKAISRLETRLKTMLLHRTSRRVALTDAGLAALERATRILQEGESVETEVMDHATSLRGQVRVAAPMSFGIARLAPLLPGFMLQHPEVDLQVHFSDAQMDLIAERFDLALRIANLEDSSLLARQLCRVRLLLVGSPAYFQRHGQPRHPSDLLRHRALLYGHTPSGAPWHFRHPQLGEFTQVMHAQLQANNAEALTPALLAGMGLALQPAFLVWPLLQSGQLQIAMEDWQADPIALHILTPPGRIRPARVQAFIDYVAACLPQEPWVELQ